MEGFVFVYVTLEIEITSLICEQKRLSATIYSDCVGKLAS